MKEEPSGRLLVKARAIGWPSMGRRSIICAPASARARAYSSQIIT